MKFAHIADCHIGGWSEPKMKQLGMEAFDKAVNRCIGEKVDFILISGDLFNSALPQIELIGSTVGVMKKAVDSGIKIFIVAGSHDFSPSGKTMLDVIEKAGLCENVVKINNNRLEITEHDTTKIAGMLGRKGGLEKDDYSKIDMSNLEEAKGFKIFMFHSAIAELTPKEMEEIEVMAISSLPKNFDYYAGGHVHSIMEKEYGRGEVVFPGPLFPNNFREMEELKNGGFYIVEKEGEKLKREYIPIKMKETIALSFNANGKTAAQLNDEILTKASSLDAEDKIVLMRVEGILGSGKPSDIDFKEIFSKLGKAYFVMKNTGKFGSLNFEVHKEIKDIEYLEPELIKESCGKTLLFDKESEQKLVSSLIASLDKEKEEGEKTSDFETRISADAIGSLGIREHF